MDQQQSAANDLLFEVKNGIGRVTFNRPQARNVCVPKTSSADEFGAPARCRVAWRDFCRLGDMAIRKT